MTYPIFDLQLFAEGSAPAGEGASVEGTAVSTPAKSKGTDSLSNVLYGKQTAVEAAPEEKAAPTTQEIASEDREAAFKNLIKGEYKDLYDKTVQDAIQKRFKNSADLEGKLKALEPLLSTLGKKYGVDGQDAAALVKAVEEDDSYYEEEALEKGVSVEQLKAFKKMERENGELRRQIEEQRQHQEAEKTYAAWMQQAQEVSNLYKGFDLNAELQNPQFVKLMRVPDMDVRTAFEVVHKDELMPAAMQLAAKTVEAKLANSIRSGSRPSENGSNSSAAVVKTDPSKFTSKDLAEIRKRVSRGEKIVF